MTDNEIIKALECCATLDSSNCKKCPCREICNENDGTLTKSTLDLIKRQKAEIERLKGSVVTNNIMEIQRIKREAKSEAIKEFAERLCNGRVSNDPVVIAVKVELTEMTEVETNQRKEDEGK